MEYSLIYIPFERSENPIFLYSVKGKTTFGFLLSITIAQLISPS